MGVNSGAKSPVSVPVLNNYLSMNLLAEGKGVAARRGLKEAVGKDVGRRTKTSYKAESLGNAAPHVKARGTGNTVNGVIVHRHHTWEK